MATEPATYRMIWRWHFYAGLLVIPFILILSLTGAAYLFKPQIDRWEERHWQNLSTAGSVEPTAQLEAALAAHPGARFHSYRLPERQGDAAMIHLALPNSGAMQDVFVSPQGRVLASIDPESRLTATLARIHGSLMLGHVGDWIVELAASWAIVMILTGLYLWWPDGRGLAGVLWPRLHLGTRAAWRDLHAVTGFWVSGLALVLLITGLPWAGVWGEAFRMARAELGLVKGAQDWKTGAIKPASPHTGHDHQAMATQDGATSDFARLDHFVEKARAETMAFPVLVIPPRAPQRFGPPNGAIWTVKSEAQNRPLVRSVSFDPVSGAVVQRSAFADKHVIDRAVNYGIAWHEGQLFGLANQLVGVATALMLMTLAVSGFVMWRKRRPDGLLGAPPAPASPMKLRGVAIIVLALAALLPLLAASLILLWLIERLILRRIAPVARWLGLAAYAERERRRSAST
jgi:uncharacterized iron-regulated membrane protein